MINLTERELIEYLEQYADGKITQTNLVKKLNTDNRTLQNKIIELSITYPNLYYKIIMNHPMMPKKRTDIDFEALMIYIMKNGITVGQATEIFNISRKTLQRRANEIAKTNPSLAQLYKQVTYNNKRGKKNSIDIEEQISQLDERAVVLGDINDEREQFLLSVEKQFNNLVVQGMSGEEAAKKMGYHSNSVVFKMLNELYRIRIEKNVKADFKERMKVDTAKFELEKNINQISENTEREEK